EKAYPSLGALANVQRDLRLVTSIPHQEGERRRVGQGRALAGNRQGVIPVTRAFLLILAWIEEGPLHAEPIRRKVIRKRKAGRSWQPLRGFGKGLRERSTS